MVKKLLKTTVLCIAFISSGSLFGQAGDYAFSTSTGTYTPLGGSATTVSAVEADSGEDDIEIGFDFYFEGVAYDSVAVTSDGYLSFMLGATSTATNDLDNGSAARRPLIAPLWDDHDGRASSSSASYEITGTAPNRVFTFEWRDWEWSWNSTDSVVSFQVKLYETTDVIEFHYRWECASCITGPDASIGLSGISTFLSVTGVGTGTPTASKLTEDSGIDTVVTNQIFTFTPPSCVAPVFSAATGVTPTSATVNFSGGAGNYELNWDTAGFVQGAATSNTVNLTTNTYTATGLTAATSYDFYVRKDCGANGFSGWTGPFTVTTSCIAYTGSFSTAFDTDIDGQVAQCWNQYSTYSGAYSRVEALSSFNATQPRSGANVLELYSSFATATDTVMAITPQFSDMTSGNKQVVFWAASASISNELYVGTTSSQSGTSSITYIDTITFASNNTYQEVIMDFTTANGYNGTDEYVVLQHNNGAAFSDIYIDDFEYQVMPACPKPTALSHSNITTNSVDLSWQSSGSGPWYVYWGPCGFDQASSGISLDTSTSVNYTLSGLTSGTSYQYYLFEGCGVDLSDTLDGGCFNTLCVTQTLPYTENFDADLGCFSVADSGSTNDTWVQAPAGGVPGFTGDFNGTGYALVDSDGAGSGNLLEEYLTTPEIDASGLTGALVVDFDQWYQNIGADRANVEVWDGTQWVTILIQSSSAGTGFTNIDHQSIDVSAYANANFKLRFVYDDNNSWAWQWAIDNFEIREVNCLSSTMLTDYSKNNTSISINWMPGDGITYGVEYGLSGFTPGTGSTFSTVDTFAVVTGLIANTSYDFYVYDTCTTGNSQALGPVSIATLCNNVVAPYLENFDGSTWIAGNAFGTGDTIDGCWSRNSETGYKWSVFNGTTGSTNTGPDADHTTGTDNFLYTEASSTVPAVAELYSPLIDVSGLTKPYVSFWYHRYGAVANMGDMKVEVNDGSGWVTMITQTGTEQTSGNDPFAQIGFEVTSFGDTIQVRFASTAKSCCSGDMAIDDFEINEAPSCLPILNLTADGIVDTSATFRWDSTSTANSYEVWYGPQGFYQGTATTGGTRAITNGDSLVVDTLSDLTCYEFVVRGICGPGDTTLWAGPYVFCTPPTCPQPTALGADPAMLTINSADIYWTSGGASDFNVEYGAAGFTPGTGTMVNTTNDTLALTSLMPGTEYEFYVRDSCGLGDVSLWSGPFSFVTAFNTNYLEDFTLNPPFAWSEADGQLTANTTFTASTSSWLNGQFGNAGSSAQRVNIWLGNQFEWLISPSIYLDPAITNLQMELDVAVTAYASTNQGYFGSDDSLVVVISTDNGKTWSNTNVLWYADATDTVDAAGEHVIVPLTGYSGYVRFGIYAGSVIDDPEDNDWYVDNFEVRTPRSCTPPTALKIDEIKTDSALVYWTEGTPGFINGEVFYTVGNQPATAGTLINTTNDSVYLTGLTNATSYCVYVVEECVNGFSDTLGPVCFTTKCLPQSLPYLEDFNVSLGCFNAIDGGSSNDTWMQVQDYTDFNGTHTVDGSPGFAFVDSDGAGSGNLLSEILESAEIDASGIAGPLVLTYDHYFNNISSDSAIVEVFDGTNWIRVAGYGSDQGSWTSPNRDSIDISAYASASLQVRFRFEDNNVWAWYWAVDNVSIRELSSCPTASSVSVANISCDSVEVSWTSDATVTSSYVEYGSKGFSLGSGTVVPNATSPLTINGLMMNTEYDVYVVDSCSMVGSNPSSVTSFKTDSVGPVMASFTFTQVSTTLTDADVDLDGSGSTGDGLSYDWDFDNGSTGSSVNAQANYTANGTYNVMLTVTDRCGNTDDTTITITVAGISIVENIYNAGIEMYPNPSNGTFKVNVTNGPTVYTIEVVDLSGKTVYQVQDIATGTAHNVELKNKAKGVYMVRLSGDGLNVTQRIVID